MSFFGFDPTGPPKKDNVETYNFEETYEGLGEHPDEKEDALNAETFGDDVYVGRDFDFGGGESAPAPAPKPLNSSYAAVAHKQPVQQAQVDDILQPMASLWGSEAPQQQQQQQPQQHQQQQQQPEQQKILSLEEIEAQLLGGNGGNVSSAPQLPHGQMFPPPPGAFPNFMIPPGAPGFPPPQMMYGNQPFPFPPPPMGVPPPQFQQQAPPHLQQQVPQQQAQAPAQPPTQPQQPEQSPQQPQQPSQQPPQHPPQQPQQQQVPRVLQGRPNSKENVAFPVLGSAEAEKVDRSHHQPQQGDRQQHYGNQRGGQQYQQQRNRPAFNPHNVNNPDLTPEERERLIRRQEKVARITRYSGVMNPKDKDYVTRFQLSQIFTDDPYNEDFYYQVHKVINNQGSNHIDGMSSIAQNYLEQSGHRLGGKYRRADVALQRMQQQVSRAVTVAKERGPKQGILTREGALGKVSFGTVKKPRTTLVIKAKEGDIEIDAADVPQPPAELKISKSSRKFHLYLIETIFGITLRYESLEREGVAIDNTELLSAIFDEKDSSDNAFAYIFNYEKGLKVFPRFFRFLEYDQKLKTIDLIFKNLQKIDIIVKSSYKSYPDSKVPTDVNKKIEVFQVNVLKNLVLFLSEATFQEVLNLFIGLLTQNNVSFLCTTKIGLSIITISISRVELLKQEFGASLTADDLTTWSNIYDNLFQQLEGKLTEIFPPALSSAAPTAGPQSSEDDSYIWQFLASLALAGKLNHQRIIVDEIRDEIFGVQKKTKEEVLAGNFERANKLIGDLNLFLNVMGLKANENDISELV